jgi:hypothetical protein
VLVVVDAWLDTVPGFIRVRDPQDARQALHPWKDLATATDAAVLLLVHTNRLASANARDRYGATYALRQKARLTLYAQCDDEGRLLVGPEKMNNGAPCPSSLFTITPVRHFEPTDDDDGTVPLLRYAGQSDRTAREHVAASVDPAEEEQGGNPAKRFLFDYLIDHGGEDPAADCIKAGRAAGFGEQELKDARRRHRKPRIESRKASFGGGWVWALADAESRKGGDEDVGGVGGEEGDTPPIAPSSPPTPPWLGVSSDPPPSSCGVCGRELIRDESIALGLCAECELAANNDPDTEEESSA